MGRASLKRIIRVFPRKTLATPEDDLVRINVLPNPFFDEADEVHVSVTFTWDLKRAEELADAWKVVAPVKIGGPATGMRSEEFVPGMYMKKGLTITSRGCPNRCYFCYVPKREGFGLRELPIHDGHELQDDNLLACSEKHIREVFAMLRRQKERIKFTGGLEAARLQPWHIEELTTLDIQSAFFAYDTPDDLEPLQRAGKMLAEAGLIGKNTINFKCYVLTGFPKDDFGIAELRIHETMRAGFIPYIMLYRDKVGALMPSWVEFRRRWKGKACIMRNIAMEFRKSLLSSIK